MDIDIKPHKVVPTLKGESNWTIWIEGLQGYLCSCNTNYWKLLQQRYVAPNQPTLYEID
jgi:hypothetical protein